MACCYHRFQGGGLLLPLKPASTKALCSAINADSMNYYTSGLSFASSASINDNRSSRSGSWKTRAGAFSTGDLRPQMDENPEGILSGEWPENFSLLSYEDLRAYLQSQIIAQSSHKMSPAALLREVMSAPVRTVTADLTLEEVEQLFEDVSGLPVVDGELRCIGIVSKNDSTRTSKGLKAKVAEVMSSPAITLSPDKTVKDAAALMLKKKIHRIPILNEERRVIARILMPSQGLGLWCPVKGTDTGIQTDGFQNMGESS